MSVGSYSIKQNPREKEQLTSYYRYCVIDQMTGKYNGTGLQYVVECPSYLAKHRTKVNGDGKRNFGCSRGWAKSSCVLPYEAGKIFSHANLILLNGCFPYFSTRTRPGGGSYNIEPVCCAIGLRTASFTCRYLPEQWAVGNRYWFLMTVTARGHSVKQQRLKCCLRGNVGNGQDVILKNAQ